MMIDAIDINEDYENHISLWNTQPTNAVKILQTVVNHYHLQKSINNRVQYPTLLVCGERDSGRRCLAKAVHNSFGNLYWKETEGLVSGYGQDLATWLRETDEHTTVFIQNAESLSAFCINVILTVIREKRLLITHKFDRNVNYIPFESRLIILSANTQNLNRLLPILDVVSIRVNLPYKRPKGELFKIVQQRCSFLGWECSDTLLRNISQVSSSIGQCVEILDFTQMVSMGEKMSSSHLNKALQLLSANSPSQAQQ